MLTQSGCGFGSPEVSEQFVSAVQFSSVQFKTVSMRSEKPIIYALPPRLSEVFPTSALKRFQCSSD